MNKDALLRFAVGLGFAASAAAATAYVYGKRDFLFEWDWARVHGKFEETVEPRLVIAARDLAESKRPGEVCVAKALGKDEKFLFLAVGCGRFSPKTDTPLLAARVRYSGERVSALEIPQREAYPNSLRRVLPQEAFEKMRYGFPRKEILQAGLERMRERGL